MSPPSPRRTLAVSWWLVARNLTKSYEAENIADEKKISFRDAMLSVIETPYNTEQVVKAFTRLPVNQGQSASEKVQIDAYLDTAI